MTVTGVTANNKGYDGTTAATLNTAAASLVGVIAPDVVVLNSANAVGTFDSANSGSNKTVTITGLTVNNPNYTVIQPTTTATITPANTTTTLVANPQATTGGSLVTFTATAARHPARPAPSPSRTMASQSPAARTWHCPAASRIFSTMALSIGSHQIIADYTGSSNFAASTSNAQSVVITGVATTTTLINNGPNPALLTQPIHLTVNVAGGISTNGETVQVPRRQQRQRACRLGHARRRHGLHHYPGRGPRRGHAQSHCRLQRQQRQLEQRLGPCRRVGCGFAAAGNQRHAKWQYRRTGRRSNARASPVWW